MSFLKPSVPKMPSAAKVPPPITEKAKIQEKVLPSDKLLQEQLKSAQLGLSQYLIPLLQTPKKQ